MLWCRSGTGPIDNMYFLVERSKQPRKNRATLLSSESGDLFWWCLFGRHSLLGKKDMHGVSAHAHCGAKFDARTAYVLVRQCSF